MKTAFFLLCATLLAGSVAAAPPGVIDAYLVPKANVDAFAEGRRDADEAGNGFGLRALVPLRRRAVIIAEYQSTGYADDIDYEQYRLGIGTASVAAGGPALSVEYVGTHLDTSAADGFGMHLKFSTRPERRAQLYADAGYLVLDDGAERLVGWEGTAGTVFRLTRRFGAFVDGRLTSLRGESSRLELQFTDVRAGVRTTFGRPHTERP